MTPRTKAEIDELARRWLNEVRSMALAYLAGALAQVAALKWEAE
jgi:hypothetical protein